MARPKRKRQESDAAPSKRGGKSAQKSREIVEDDPERPMNNVENYVPIEVKAVALCYQTEWKEEGSELTWEPRSAFKDQEPGSVFALFRDSDRYRETIKALFAEPTGTIAAKSPSFTLSALAASDAETKPSRITQLKIDHAKWDGKIDIIGGRPGGGDGVSSAEGETVWAVRFDGDATGEPLWIPHGYFHCLIPIL